MPHSPNEFANHKIIGRFVENDLVKELLASCQKPDFPEDARADGQHIERRSWCPRYVVAIDGSHQEIAYERGFPGAEIGFLSLASVLINVEVLQAESSKSTIDPIAFSQVQSAYTVTAALPSANMIRAGQPDARASFRTAWYELLVNTRPGTNSETLLDTYEVLLRHKTKASTVACPLKELCPREEKPSPDFSTCHCACGLFPVYSTDALDIHDRFTDTSSNGESMGEVMRVLEHLVLVAYLREMERVCDKTANWTMFNDTAVVMDGSLAVFGNPAWLSQAIKLELKRLNQRVREKTGEDVLVFGIEKSGRFFDHWVRLDTKSKKDFEREEREHENDDPTELPVYSQGRLAKQSVLLVTDAYTKRYVVPSDSQKWHGKDTYYGRPFLYKTRTGALIVGQSAILDEVHNDRNTARPEQFPRLPDVLDLLDLLVSMRYPNATIPLIAAHAEAAIPLQMGEKVLDRLAHEHIGKNSH